MIKIFFEDRRDTTQYATNKDMNADVYKLRRRVMEYIYRAKNLLGGQMPRITVRIVDLGPEAVIARVLGLARRGENIIWIPEKTVNMNDLALHFIVFHELVHVIYNVGHDNSFLMSDTFSERRIKSHEQIDDAFLNYSD